MYYSVYHLLLCYIAFSALTLLVGHQEERPACKNWVMRCWCGYLSGARCRLFAYGPADATAKIATVPKSHHLLPYFNPHWFHLLVLAYPGCPGKEAVKVSKFCVTLLLRTIKWVLCYNSHVVCICSWHLTSCLKSTRDLLRSIQLCLLRMLLTRMIGMHGLRWMQLLAFSLLGKFFIQSTFFQFVIWKC